MGGAGQWSGDAHVYPRIMMHRRAAEEVIGCLLLAMAGASAISGLTAAEAVHLEGVPDYAWHVGCFGTATGNLFGYWDRHGFPDFYTGPTAGGVAPLNSRASQVHSGIRSLWSSAAGRDGRPADLPGHEDDYYVGYESVAADPYVTRGRPEHAPDCIGDFIGLSQNKWAELNGECRGNVDAYAFVFWDRSGARRVAAPGTDDIPPRADIPNGLVDWSRYRGYEAESFCQLADFNPEVSAGPGFTFADLKAEIDAGYPVLLFLQPTGEFSRTLRGQEGVNPDIHGMLAYGYVVDDDGTQYVRFRTSWATGDLDFAPWGPNPWTPNGQLNYPLRGVIGYRPAPRIRSFDRLEDSWRLRWDGPASILVEDATDERRPAHAFVVERTLSLESGMWTPVGPPQTERELTIPADGGSAGYFRVRVAAPE